MVYETIENPSLPYARSLWEHGFIVRDFWRPLLTALKTQLNGECLVNIKCWSVAIAWKTVTFQCLVILIPSVFWHCWCGVRKGARPVKTHVTCAAWGFSSCSSISCRPTFSITNLIVFCYLAPLWLLASLATTLNIRCHDLLTDMLSRKDFMSLYIFTFWQSQISYTLI